MEALDHGPKDGATVEGAPGWKPGGLDLNLYSAPNPLCDIYFSEIKGNGDNNSPYLRGGCTEYDRNCQQSTYHSAWHIVGVQSGLVIVSLGKVHTSLPRLREQHMGKHRVQRPLLSDGETEARGCNE